MKQEVCLEEKRYDEDATVLVNLPQTGLDSTHNLDNLSGIATKQTRGPAGITNKAVLKGIFLASIYILASMVYLFTISYSKLNYVYSVAPLVTMIEVMKMLISIELKYCIDGEFIPKTVLFSNTRGELWRKGLRYAIPALLYAVYNNMTFDNLDKFDLGTYQVFMQTRIWITGIAFTLILGQALSLRKWIALIILALGVAIKYFSPATIEVGGWVGLVILQALISSLAGVYNECMFKSDPGLSIHTQNFFMYFYGIVFNMLFGIVTVPNFCHKLSVSITETRTLGLIVLIGAVTGITASFILKFIDVIVKALASGVEVPLTAIMAAVLIKEPLYVQDVVAAIIVMLAVYMYYTKGFGDSRLIHLNFRRQERLSVIHNMGKG